MMADESKNTSNGIENVEDKLDEYRKLMREEMDGRLRETLEYLKMSDGETSADVTVEEILAGVSASTERIANSGAGGELTSPYANKKRRTANVRTYEKMPKVNVHAGHRVRIRECIGRNARLAGFTDIELVEAVLSFLVPQRDTNVTAHALLDKFGSIAGVMTAEPDELFKVMGMTRNAAILLPALWKVCMVLDGMEVCLTTRLSVINFLDALFVGGMETGGYVLYLDDAYKVCSFTCVKDKPPNLFRTIVNRATESCANFVIPVVYGHAPAIGRSFVKYYVGLQEVLDNIGVQIIDILFLADNGYYAADPCVTVPSDCEPIMTFIPTIFSRRTLRATEAMARLRNRVPKRSGGGIIDARIVSGRRELPIAEVVDAEDRKVEHNTIEGLCEYLKEWRKRRDDRE